MIVGAMKSGTSTLHHILAQHESVYIPDREIAFFDIDDIRQHHDFFVKAPDTWTFHDYDKYFDQYLSWYQSLFEEAQSDQLIGEDSTTYMASRKAPQRIAKLLPGVKLIFLLRDPVSRTYSHYWHLVRTGRAIYDFERMIQYCPCSLLQRSFYRNHVSRYQRFFPDKNLHFVIFEDFISDTQKCITEICNFLNLSSTLDISQIDTHINPAVVPRSLKVQLFFNRIFRDVVAKRYFGTLPNMPTNNTHRILKVTRKILNKINLVSDRYPPMKPETKSFLQNLFANENRGLSDLIGKDVVKYWPYMKE